VFGAMGEEIDSGPVALGVWHAAVVLPWLYEGSIKRVSGVALGHKSVLINANACINPEAT